MAPNLLQKISNLFNKKSNSPAGILKISVEEAPMLIEKEFGLKKRELEDFTGKKLSECKYLHSKSAQLLELISKKELEEKDNQRLNRAALTSKTQLENQLKKILEKINPTERGKTLQDARAYSGESYTLLLNEIISFRKNIAYTSYYLKDEMKTLGETLQELLNYYGEMNKKYSESKELFEFEKAKGLVGIILEKKKGMEKIVEQKTLVEDKMGEVQKKIVLQKEKISQKREGKDFQKVRALEEEMTKLMDQKQELKTEISALLINIDRPLARFKQLVDSGRWKLPKEEKEMLEQFITNPILALKKDPRADVFKKVLNEIIRAIEDGEIELKDREKEKRLQALQELINFDFFGKVFWRMNELQKKQTELNQQISQDTAKKDLAKEEENQRDLEKQLFELNEKKEEIGNELKKAQKDVLQELNSIKEFTQKVLGKTILFEEEAY
jgi:hypothetical protein